MTAARVARDARDLDALPYLAIVADGDGEQWQRITRDGKAIWRSWDYGTRNSIHLASRFGPLTLVKQEVTA